MKKLTVVLLTAFFGGCYTELQVAKEETSYRPYVPPDPIVIIEPYYPPPCPCPNPPPRPPRQPVIIQPVEQVAAPPVMSERPRREGSTRDDRAQADHGGRRR